MKKVIVIMVIAVLALGMFGCGGGGGGTTPPPPGEQPSVVKIGISLPTQREERWVLDKESFESTAESMGIEVNIQIADNDAGRQQTQCENLITQGVTALIVAPHDGEAAKNIVEIAHEAGVPVISYDRLIMDADVDLYVTFDQYKIGYLMGEYIANNVESGNIVILKGDPLDNTTIPLREGAVAAIQSKLDSGAFKIVAEQDCIDWQPSAALRHMEQALTANNNDIQGVIAQNDGTAGGAIQALAAVGLDGKVPVTGQDCESDAIKRIREGTQGMTVFFDVRDMSAAAFQAAVKMSKGEDPGSDSTENNGKIDVKVLGFPATSITKDNWDLPIKAGYMDAADVE
ncbi:MAG: substrate-binding domain-containing protein [Clostridiales bacterium]|nr:substrate-binding domain-containing protein [Clostridiales bacterium]